MKKILANLSLIVASLVFSLLLVEGTLRYAFPRYQSAAETKYDPDALGLWSPRPNRKGMQAHPDTGANHFVIHNGLATRQSREIENLESRTNIAFFGDSYTVNAGLPAPYSFTEPLDYLLNLRGEHFNVLNFGVNGYGTDQTYLLFRNFERKKHLSHVFYVLCANDLRNIFETDLYSLGDRGELIRNPAVKSPWWIKLISRMHTTYLVLDVRQRLIHSREGGLDRYNRLLREKAMKRAKRAHKERFESPVAYEIQEQFLEQEENVELARVIVIFQALLFEWKQQVEANGGAFHIVLLPTGREELFKEIIGDDYDVISLYERFVRSDEAFTWESIRFKNDGHWAEEGNMLAAAHLYKYLEEKIGLSPLPIESLWSRLYTYYSAFDFGWMPSKSAKLEELAPAVLSDIRNKYISLEIAASAEDAKP
ncbi:MAG: SGNH/GDSL hydrolase family protein [Pseudomonadota bacterium]